MQTCFGGIGPSVRHSPPPGDTPNRGWATKEEEIKTHLFNAVRLVLVLANVSCGQRKSVGSEDVGCIVDEGFAGYEKVWEKFAE